MEKLRARNIFLGMQLLESLQACSPILASAAGKVQDITLRSVKPRRPSPHQVRYLRHGRSRANVAGWAPRRGMVAPYLPVRKQGGCYIRANVVAHALALGGNKS